LTRFLRITRILFYILGLIMRTKFYISAVFNFASVRKDKEMEFALDNLTIVRYNISNSR